MKIIKYVSFRGSYCKLSTDSRAQILREEGTNNVSEIRNATAADIESVRSMGGYVPEGRIVRYEKDDGPISNAVLKKIRLAVST